MHEEFSNALLARQIEQLKKENQELQSAQAYYREILNHSQDIIFRRNFRKGAIEYANHTITKVLGYTEEEISSMNTDELSDLIHPEDRSTFLDILTAGVQCEESSPNLTLEYRIKTKAGEYIWLREQLTIVKDAEGVPVFIIGNARDITVPRQTEEALRESEQKFRSVVDNIGIGIAIISRAMEIVALNPTMKKWFPHIDETKRPLCYESFNNLPQKTVCSHCPTVLTLRDGQVHEAVADMSREDQIVNYRIISSPIKDESDSVTAAIKLVEDITEQRRTQEVLQKLTHDLEERVKELNCLYEISNLVQQPNISLKEILQRTVELVHFALQFPESACTRITFEDWVFTTSNFVATLWKQTSEIMVNGKRSGSIEVFYLEEQTTINDGLFQKEEWDLLNAVAERLGKIVQLRRAEDALKITYDELELKVKERTAQLARANEELEKENAERRQLENELRASEAFSRALNEHVLNMLMVGSHDLRAPLTSIGAMLKLLIRGVYGEMDVSVANTLADLYARVNKVLGAAEDCLGKASVAAGNVEFERKVLDLRGDIIDPVLDELSDDIEKQSIVIDSRLGAIPANKILINTNRVWLKIVFRNLFHNAIKYGGQGTKISFGFEDSGSCYRLNVYNSGEPVAEHLRDKLFSKFFRTHDTEERPNKGMGLGLYLSKEIVEKHGGRIWYEAKEHGSNFVFTIPYD